MLNGEPFFLRIGIYTTFSTTQTQNHCKMSADISFEIQIIQEMTESVKRNYDVTASSKCMLTCDSFEMTLSGRSHRVSYAFRDVYPFYYFTSEFGALYPMGASDVISYRGSVCSVFLCVRLWFRKRIDGLPLSTRKNAERRPCSSTSLA